MATALSARGLLVTAELALGALATALGCWALAQLGAPDAVVDAKDRMVGLSLAALGLGWGLPLLGAGVWSLRAPAQFARAQALLCLIPMLHFVLLILPR